MELAVPEVREVLVEQVVKVAKVLKEPKVAQVVQEAPVHLRLTRAFVGLMIPVLALEIRVPGSLGLMPRLMVQV